MNSTANTGWASVPKKQIEEMRLRSKVNHGPDIPCPVPQNTAFLTLCRVIHKADMLICIRKEKHMDQKKTGSLLKELRKEKGMTQEQLAEYLNVSGRTISRWETGANLPDLDLLVTLSDYYDIDIRELLDGERKSEKMNEELKETLLKTADYTNHEKQQIAKRMCVLFSLGLVAFIIYLVLEYLGMADSGITEDIASAALGFSFGIMICGVLYTSGWLFKFKAFKKRLLDRH